MKNCIVFCLFVFFMFSCGDSKKDSNVQQVESSLTAEAKMKNDLERISIMEDSLKQNAGNKEVANRLLMNYIDFTNHYHESTASEDMTMSAASLADGLGKYPKAIELLLNYSEGFPQGKRKDEAAYLIAFIYDAHIGDKQKAALYYNKVIELYPESMWAQQAKDALKIVFMSDEEVIKNFQEKNQ